MRVWDINPGYLNRQSLLGEHREIHALFSVLWNHKKGYSRHPETLRWVGKLSALEYRHNLLVAEMHLRGYGHHSPMTGSNDDPFQHQYVDSPFRQFEILKQKYEEREKGRIPMPMNAQQLWAQHKYSVLARDPEYYKAMGPKVSGNKDDLFFETLCLELVELLQIPPKSGRLLNAIQHMWGYVDQYEALPQNAEEPRILLEAIRRLSFQHNVIYLIQSTALSDLKEGLRPLL